MEEECSNSFQSAKIYPKFVMCEIIHYGWRSWEKGLHIFITNWRSHSMGNA